MVNMVADTFEFIIDDTTSIKRPGKRYMVFEYDPNTEMDIIHKIQDIVDTQPMCTNCVHLNKPTGCFCGFEATLCEIHDNIYSVDNPHHDCDGSKCENYKRKEC